MCQHRKHYSCPKTLKVRKTTSEVDSRISVHDLEVQRELPLLTITINTNLPASLLPVLDDRRGRVDDRAVHIEEQSGKVDDVGRGREVVFFVVRHVVRV